MWEFTPKNLKLLALTIFVFTVKCQCSRSLFKYWFYRNFACKQKKKLIKKSFSLISFWNTLIWSLLIDTKNVNGHNLATLYLLNQRSRQLKILCFSISHRYLLLYQIVTKLEKVWSKIPFCGWLDMEWPRSGYGNREAMQVYWNNSFKWTVQAMILDWCSTEFTFWKLWFKAHADQYKHLSCMAYILNCTCHHSSTKNRNH